MDNENSIFSNLVVLITFIVIVFVSGIIAAIIYYDMGLIDSALQTVNFDIPIEVPTTNPYLNITDFQSILGATVYPILGLRTALPYLTYFLIFGLIIALGISSYMSSKNPVFFGVHVLFTLVMTYFCILLSNSYQELLSNSFFNTLMINFQIYNKIMLYLPQIFFFSSLLFAIISFIVVIKPRSSNFQNQSTLNYGGDF